MVQAIKRTRKQRADAAIAYALERRWDLAADENRAILEEYPDDTEAANRLGKALTEVGDPEGAVEAYRRTLAADPTNAIAKRNLARLEESKGQAQAAKKKPVAKRPTESVAAVRPQSLIEESGKSAEFTLEQPNASAVRRLSAGDTAELVPTPRGVSVRSATGAILGHIEPRAGLRLRRMMEGGNRYAVVIRHIEDGEATVYVRETYRDPSLLDQASFLPPATARRRAAAPRAYTKASIVQYAGPVDLGDEDDDSDDWTPAGAGDDEDDDFADRGFGHANLDDDDEAEAALGDDDEDEPLVDDDEEL